MLFIYLFYIVAICMRVFLFEGFLHEIWHRDSTVDT